MNRPDYNEARKRTKEMVRTRNFTLEDKYKKIGQGKKFFLKTYGCQMNEHDSENIKVLFSSKKDLLKLDSYKQLDGLGLCAKINSKTYYLANGKIFDKLKLNVNTDANIPSKTKITIVPVLPNNP